VPDDLCVEIHTAIEQHDASALRLVVANMRRHADAAEIVAEEEKQSQSVKRESIIYCLQKTIDVHTISLSKTRDLLLALRK
jgi:hypothetical protein